MGTAGRVGVVTIACALMSVATAPAAQAGGSSCLPRGYVVEKKTRTTVIVRRRHSHAVYGCLRSRGRLVRLPDAVGGYAAAGRFVAYEQDYSGPTDMTYLVIVRDLVRGTVRRAEAVYSESRAGDDGFTPATVTDIVLKRNGSVAWISCIPFEGRCGPRAAEAPYQVWRSDRRGARLLDSSEAIRLKSLRLDGRTMSWRRGTERRTAGLR